MGTIVHLVLDKLQALRDRLGKPLIVRSAIAAPNTTALWVGGAPRSKHMDGTALDIAMSNHDLAAFEAATQAVGFLGFGFYPRSGFMHIDLGSARVSWLCRHRLRRARICCACAPDRREIWMVNRVLDNVIIIDPASFEIVADIEEGFGETPDIIAMSPDSSRA